MIERSNRAMLKVLITARYARNTEKAKDYLKDIVEKMHKEKPETIAKFLE